MEEATQIASPTNADILMKYENEILGIHLRSVCLFAWFVGRLAE